MDSTLNLILDGADKSKVHGVIGGGDGGPAVSHAVEIPLRPKVNSLLFQGL